MAEDEPKRGRPLDPEIDDAIVARGGGDAARGRHAADDRAGGGGGGGVAKTTVYRRYATPAQLALAAIGRMNADSADPATGSARGDLVEALDNVREPASTRP